MESLKAVCFSLVSFGLLIQSEDVVVKYSCAGMGLKHFPEDIPVDTEVLECMDSELSYIPLSALERLTKLRTAKLAHNLITGFPNMSPVQDTLTYLKLGSNNLCNVSFENFNRLTKLESLNLKENKLTKLPVICDFVENLEITLDDNPIVCDADIAWILTQGIIVSGTCGSPVNLQGQDIASLNYADLQIDVGRSSI